MENCPEDTIRKFFTHFLKQFSNSGADAEKEINFISLQIVERDATEHGMPFTSAALSVLLN